MKSIILLPTYNERENLPIMLQAIHKVLPTIHILVIDDNSPDETGKIAESLKQQHANLQVLHRKEKQGLGRAYMEGFQMAIAQEYDKIITMDCDFSHDPKELPNLLNEAQKYDLVLGSRYIRGGKVVGWSLWRKFISRGGNIYARLILGVKYKDLTGGFKCYDRKALKNVSAQDFCSQGYTFQIETTYRFHLRKFSIKEIPITFKDRIHGKSKMTFDIAWEAIKMIPRLRYRRKF